MTRTVVVRPRADADIAMIARHIGRTASVASAAAWARNILGTIGALATDAEQWPEADEAADLGTDLRCWIHGRRHQVYRVLFVLDGNDVFVLRVLHAARDRLTPDDL
jgi:plasmid stabilization system protein ParE